jgi:tripartite-type tricarboxylate transporter receptor subunit TctC
LQPARLRARRISRRARLTVVVAFSAGGPVDVVARVYADRLAQCWGVPVTVESRTGAGGNIAAAIVLVQDPDVRRQLANAELSPRRQSLGEAAEFLRSELANWNRMVGAIGLKPR